MVHIQKCEGMADSIYTSCILRAVEEQGKESVTKHYMKTAVVDPPGTEVMTITRVMSSAKNIAMAVKSSHRTQGRGGSKLEKNPRMSQPLCEQVQAFKTCVVSSYHLFL